MTACHVELSHNDCPEIAEAPDGLVGPAFRLFLVLALCLFFLATVCGAVIVT